VALPLKLALKDTKYCDHFHWKTKQFEFSRPCEPLKKCLFAKDTLRFYRGAAELGDAAVAAVPEDVFNRADGSVQLDTGNGVRRTSTTKTRKMFWDLLLLSNSFFLILLKTIYNSFCNLKKPLERSEFHCSIFLYLTGTPAVRKEHVRSEQRKH
jgi:hypothetical protein